MIEQNRALIPWLVNHYKNGSAIASLCVGAFLLAATGLLKGRKCATHWVEAANFRAMFPDVHLVPHQVITDEQNIFTSGGAYSWLHLVLHLVEKFAGRDIAIFCSKIFEIEPGRSSQSSFMIFEPLKKHEDEVIMKAQEFIENNYDDKIMVDDLASRLAISRRNLERRFKKVTYNSIVEYIQKVRIEAAKKSLESSRDNVNEVMYKVGYSDTKAFRTTFKKITGISPTEYRSKYNRQMPLTSFN